MGWFNRIVSGGIGFIFGGPIGAIIGLAIGSMIDRASEFQGSGSRFSSLGQNQHMQMQLAFFACIFSLLAKVAKADGRVSEEEGQRFLQILDSMQLDAQMREFAVNTFNQAKNSPYSHVDFAQQFVGISQHAGNRSIVLQFFYQLVSMAAVDQVLSSAEDKVLRDIARVFGLHQQDIEQAYAQFQLREQNSNYSILGLSPQASDEEVRKAHRRLAKEAHPDTLVQQGLPPEMKASAEKRFQEIQNAWESIRKERGI